jgi:hypothetical protein
VVPTRELAAGVSRVIEALGDYIRITSTYLWLPRAGIL